MAPDLLHLRTQLTHLMWARRLIRWGSACCTVLTISAILLVMLFAVDRMFRPGLSWTSLLLPGWFVGVLLLSFRYVGTVGRRADSLEEVALFVEQQHGIQNDLIAALEFTRSDTLSQQDLKLASAVIRRASEISQTLDYTKGMTLGALPKQATALGFACCGLMVIALINPTAWAIFWNRLAWGAAQYPTKTQIHWIEVNGQPVAGTAPISRCQIPQGKAVTFEVHCGGQLPTVATAELIANSNATRNKLNLVPVRAKPNLFRGELSSIYESCRVVVRAGDAVSNVVEIAVVPLPQVDVNWLITPPDYIHSSIPSEEASTNTLQVSAFEGSRIQLQLHCQNKKLKSAQFAAAGSVWELQPTDESHRIWELTAGTPLDDIRSNLTGELQVQDDDNLSLGKPLVCEIRLQPDRAPKITVSAVTRHALPSAQPKIDFAASDDFGITRITSRIRLIRDDGHQEQFDSLIVEIKPSEQPVTVLRDQFPIRLGSYQLMKGDEVRVEFTAIDWRGTYEGKSSSSDTLVFKITDLAGILHQTSEEDKKAVKQLDEILKRELSIGSESIPSQPEPTKN